MKHALKATTAILFALLSSNVFSAHLVARLDANLTSSAERVASISVCGEIGCLAYKSAKVIDATEVRVIVV